MRYYGCKDKLLDFIESGVKKTGLNSGTKFVDLFAGTTTVAKHFKKLGYTVVANDTLESSYAFAKTYIELNTEPKFLGLKKDIRVHDISSEHVIKYLNELHPKEGFITKHYCPISKKKRKYFSNTNGQKIDAIREKIQKWKSKKAITELEYYYLITALLEAVNLVSNVAGTYAAYLKKWDSRAKKDLVLVAPQIIPSKRKNKAEKKDANELITNLNADILYLDPPYNSRQYASNYFMLEVIAEGWFDKKEPEINGKTGINNYNHLKSVYCYKKTAGDALADLIENVKAKYILLSYNNEGLIPDKEIKNILRHAGKVSLFRKTHKRYRSINQKSSDAKKTEERLYFIETPLAVKRANKLDGGKWLQYSFSIWRDISKNQEENELDHPAIFPIQLSEKIIDIFVNGSGKNILDCFAGSGSTLIAGLKKNMNVYGIDLSKEFKKLFCTRVKNHYLECGTSKRTANYFVDDAQNIMKHIEPNSIDLCLTSPPYWNILNAYRSADLKSSRNYSNSKKDIGNIESYEKFISTLQNIMQEVYKTIKPNSYCIMVVMDIRRGGKFYPLHSDVTNMMENSGYSFEDMIIWDRQKEYNNCKPLGYPYKFIINKVHEYVLIFRK